MQRTAERKNKFHAQPTVLPGQRTLAVFLNNSVFLFLQCPSVILKPSRGNAVSFHSNIMESSTTAVYHRKNFLELPGVLPSMNLTDQLMARDGVTVQVSTIESLRCGKCYAHCTTRYSEIFFWLRYR